MAKAAIMGYGVVGSGTAWVLKENKELLTAKAGEEIELKYILDIRKFPGDENESLITDDFNLILNDSEVSVVAEVMGGLKPAYEFTRKLLEAGKHVVTSNKELVSVHGPELFEIAKKNNVKYLFEASVGGGIPVIKPLNECVAVNRITNIKGILNGTTNYILTQMFAEGVDFETALKDAMDKGYAEKDPSADIDGHDARRKISILASLCGGNYINPDEVHTEGISKITKDDVAYAEAVGAKIKLMGFADFESDTVTCSVEPSVVYCNNPIFSVDGVFNCVTATGNALGDVMFYGRGAGKEATASAVVQDILDAVTDKALSFPVGYGKNGKISLLPYGETKSSFLIRVSGENEYNINEVSSIMDESFGIIKIKDGEFGFISEAMKVSELEEKLASVSVIKKFRIS